MTTAAPESHLAPETVEHRTGVLAGLIQRGLAGQAASPWDDRPIREELFGIERLEQHARSLAAAQPVAARRRGRNLLRARLAENEADLLAAYRDVADAIAAGAAITPAAEWLIDNFHVVEQQVREIRADLPSGYYRQLPELAAGPFQGLPRVFGLAWAFIAHTDSLFDPEALRRYVRAYQEVQPLTIGELWAIAITLRIVLVENLRRIAGRVVASRAGRRDADAIADRLLGSGRRAVEAPAAVLPGLDGPILSEAFFVQLVQRLRDQDPSIAPALAWIDERLAAQGLTADGVVQAEHLRQVAGSVTVRNIITSMRLISDIDWSELVERFSLIDDLLVSGSRFGEMDFPTRNLYRSAIEELARGSGLSELEIARAALLAVSPSGSGQTGTPDARLSDPGYYLIGAGRQGFEAAIGFRPPPRLWPGRLYRALGIGGYVGAGALLGAAILAWPLLVLGQSGLGWRWLVVLGVLGVAPAVDLSVALVNHVVTRGFRASLLPGLELKEGVPAALRTLVVVPTMLTAKETIAEQVEGLEIHHLASPGGDIRFALLTDWADADEEHVDGDEALLALAREGVAELNRRYAPAHGGDRFLLLHRRRVWNEGERRWIGWERKRGKLAELNRYLRGATDTTLIDPPPAPASVRYVITLDSDTRLPRETVRRLIGKMAHPLNRPRLDSAQQRVVEGYAILQPRVTPSLPIGQEGSLFLRVFSSASGIDPYAAAVSDVYQDLFGEGSYTGKGIYDIDGFEAAIAGRVPDSRLLSHDLFEGIFARAGLASDVEVVEAFPARYDAAALRHHRWARGDWQLLPWMFGPGRRSAHGRGLHGVPMVGRWKMLDNLRRTLSAPSTVAALLAGWLAAPGGGALIWTTFIVATMAIPPLLPVATQATARRPGATLRGRLRTLAGDLRLAVIQVGLMLIFLGHQAWLMSDAILRTLFRLTVSHRHLLQWTPAAQAVSGRRLDLASFYRRMAGGVALSAAALAAGWLGRDGVWPIAGAFAAAWALAPAVALRASLSPLTADRRPLKETEQEALRLTARRTWRFFETFVTAESSWLPPDNFQETPEPVVAQRTSPTNLGLYLLSTASARDFGWIGAVEAVDRLETTLASMAALARYRGHFYNWYDTSDGRALDPRYVSSVDSGNLAGHLIALAGACREWGATDPAGADRLAGVADALRLARGALLALPGDTAGASSARARLLDKIDAGLRALDGGVRVERADLTHTVEELAATARSLADADVDGDLRFWTEAARRAVESHRRDSGPAAADLPRRLMAVEQMARAMALEMDFRFLLDPERLLLSIGYQTVEGVRDPSCYDLLASEARLASFVAIAKGDAPARHWFRLGRSVTPCGRGAALISWSGSMFEYLMPSLVMRGPTASLIEQSNECIVERQIEYGRRLGAPWGVSESAFNARDLEFTYQYSNFGVPGLGVKRGLADNLVIAPYATALAAMVDPRAAVRNFGRLAEVGALGRYGFYEALDLTPSRLPEGASSAVVQAYMAHHQGMSIVAIADTLLDGRMRRRFHADSAVQATELLLQERAPRDVVPPPPSVAESAASAHERAADRGGWRRGNPWSATPDTQLLSNGRYSVMLTAAGSGYSAWRDIAVTRWREDTTCDDWGSYIFLRDARSGEVWSAGLQPTGVDGDGYTAIFNEDRAEIARRDRTLTTTLEVLVSAEDDAEVRRLTLSNFGALAREIEITSYAELVLAPRAADAVHPAFSKLFVETEHLADTGALLAHRRRRSPDEPEVWAAHLAVVAGRSVRSQEFETDRARFIGRGRSVQAATSIVDGRQLSGTTGAVLDPIFALRRRLRLEPGETARVDFWTMAAGSRDEVLGLVDKHHDPGAFERAAALAWTQVQVQLHHLGINRSQAGQFQRLAGHVMFAAPTLRPVSEIIEAGRAEQPLLWGLGISGDLPIVLVRISDTQQLGLVREALLAVEYWRMRRLAVDLVILNERATSYIQDLQVALETQVRANQSRPNVGEAAGAGHVFLLRSDLVSPEVRAMLGSIARVVLTGDLGRLADQLEYAPAAEPIAPRPARRATPPSQLQIAPPASGLEYFNGIGGFDDGGREYVIAVGPGQSTPAPWINVIANPSFGFQVSAEGGGYSWSRNSRERQITPWSNDPVTDQPSQVFYLRDEETGELWTPTASPIRDEAATYVARHGFGYTQFEHASRGLELKLLEYVAADDPVRISRLSIRNTSGLRRQITVTVYLDWSLGASREASAPHVATKLDPATGAVLASTHWNPVYADRVAFADLGGRQSAWTGDRREFLGRNGGLAAPFALGERIRLSGRLGAGLDPCCALQATLELAPRASVEIPFFLGDAENEAQASQLVAAYRKADLDGVLGEARQRWDEILGAVRVKTPDRSMDLMLNGWLLYQTVASRLWARAGFSQASGAYGFRDQLQDVMALTAARPAMARDQLLRAAARQFVEGDVQHWWLPDTGQGVRTRISDDRLWLPFVAAHYVDTTGDAGVLDQRVPFIEGSPLEPGEAERFFEPSAAQDSASLYEHCARALDANLAVGVHGMPLIGGGDWNDGMNRVGLEGRGESVWLGWFLIANLRRFALFADSRTDPDRAESWRAHADALAAAAQEQAWDGDWYRRGWFDNGTPLGSAANEECRIDSIAQSWAVLSGAGDPERAARAMAAVDRELIQPQDGLALLFTPPFDHGPLDPGYVKGYPPGVRENGGQYTHAALWSVMAFAALGDGDKASALFWMLNPINHARTRTDAHRYRVEPYVVAADVYAAPGRTGRGGWTWYTGSAAWMQRAGVESILGLRRRGDRLEVDPCIPRSWPGFEVSLRLGTARYEIVVTNPNRVSRGIAQATFDGAPLEGRPLRAPFRNDGEAHRLEVTMG
ncbi:MAG TPA: glucoamylase family protein [Caulobacteraceae bacterium]|nr:glucoamylase family protein [Caulobacteraceae bacterium]